MSLLSNFTVFQTGTYTWTQPGVGSYVAGVWTAGAPTVGTIDATVQPLNSRDLELLPEGYRANGGKAVYTQTAVNVGDRITIAGEEFRVMTVQIHGAFAGDGGYYKLLVTKEDRT